MKFREKPISSCLGDLLVYPVRVPNGKLPKGTKLSKTHLQSLRSMGIEHLLVASLQKNDMIYIYSDGFQDQFGGENGKKYMAANFKKFLLKISKEEEKKQNKLLEIELANWMKNEEQIDDICIMGVRV